MRITLQMVMDRPLLDINIRRPLNFLLKERECRSSRFSRLLIRRLRGDSTGWTI
jgi:hypothetical protein